MMQVDKVIFTLIILVASCFANEYNLESSGNELKELRGNDLKNYLEKTSLLVMFYDSR